MEYLMKLRRLFILIVPALVPFVTSAQSVTIIGDSADARECYFSAQMAVQMQIASKADITFCTNALLTQNLRIRDKAATYINRGILYVAMEEYQSAIRDYNTAKKLYPEFGAIHVNRGNLFFLGEAYDSAISEYNQALSLGLSQNYVAYLNRGMAYEKLGMLYEAEADYRQAIELVPEWQIAKNKLDRVMRKIN